MERPTFKPIGTPSEQLDTPALVVDLDALESNISAVHAAVASAGARIRPRLDYHLCPAIGHAQIRGGDVSGVAVSTLGQAEVFAQHGFDDILVANLVVGRRKAARAAALARRITLSAAVDSAYGVDMLSGAAVDLGATVGMVVALSAGAESIGVSPSAAAALAARVDAAPGLTFAGLLAPDGAEGIADAVEGCAAAGLPPRMVAGGGSSSCDSAPSQGVTDVLAGAYALNDAALARRRPDLTTAARILATVITSQQPRLVWIDAGQKATSIDTGLPDAHGMDGVTVPRMSAEHGALVCAPDADWGLDVGSKVWLAPHDIANTANVYDYIHAVRGGRLEAVWEVSARGQYS